MRSRIHTVALPSDVAEFADEIRRVCLELGRTFGAASLAGECAPPIDVYENDKSVEIIVDLPGIDAGMVRVVVKGDAVLIVGEKAARLARSEASYHLVERGFGRFARTVRLARACDLGNAVARLVEGELHISLPKMTERRGQTISIPIM